MLHRLSAPIAALLVVTGWGGCTAILGATVAAAQAQKPDNPGKPKKPRRAAAGPCKQALADFQTVIDNDRAIGHLSALGYARINSELNSARAACAAGRSRDANAGLAFVRAKYGYR